jgi:hypothetical protein
MRLNDIHKRIISKIALDCHKHRISFLLYRTKKVKLEGESEKNSSGGYFCSDSKTLAVGTGSPIRIWFPILLHEYNHMLQWIEKTRHWTKKSEKLGEDFFEWLEGDKEFSKEKLKKIIKSVRDCEVDCEERTAKMIKENPQIGLNVDQYIKEANAYLFFYKIVEKYRKWSKSAPYRIKEIVELMPNAILNLDDYDNPSKEYEELVVERCLYK